MWAKYQGVRGLDKQTVRDGSLLKPFLINVLFYFSLAFAEGYRCASFNTVHASAYLIAAALARVVIRRFTYWPNFFVIVHAPRTVSCLQYGSRESSLSRLSFILIVAVHFVFERRIVLVETRMNTSFLINSSGLRVISKNPKRPSSCRQVRNVPGSIRRVKTKKAEGNKGKTHYEEKK